MISKGLLLQLVALPHKGNEYKNYRTSHFALEEYHEEIAEKITMFMNKF
jgi:hypothetical protein